MTDPTEVNYTKIDLPEDKPKPEWDPVERRAYVLEEIKEHNGPYGIRTDKIAEEFDLTPRQIRHDRKKLVRSWLEDNDEVYDQMMMDTFMDIQKLKEQGDIDKAVRAKMKWLKMGEKLGIVDTEPDQVEVDNKGDPTFNINVDSIDSDDIDEDDKVDEVDD